jgi:glutaminyl-tRNA synthetase
VVTRFPPEPNGYLHIGHTKAICLDFGVAEENGGRCHLRFDDTNPTAEEVEYVDAIKADLRWLGFDWGEHEYYASDYFGELHKFAVQLIEKGKAYVCDLSSDEIAAHRGTLTEPGTTARTARAASPRTSISSSACARRVRERREGAAREDRHGRRRT